MSDHVLLEHESFTIDRVRPVALMVTCLVDQLMPQVGAATVHLLRRAGFRVEFPSAQTCCGQPFFNSGFRPQAAELAKRMITLFEDYAAVVVPGGSCTAMIRHEYANLLAEWPAWRQRAELLATKTFELSEFLAGPAAWEPPNNASALRFTYHDSCHMNRLLGLGAQARSLLQTAGCELVEMADSDRCCGFGGVFSARMPDVSNEMTAYKLRNAAATEADVLVSCDPGCLMQMRGLANQYGVRAEHFAVLLEEVTR